MATFKIAIIGAGPSGCTLARLLLQSSIPFDITIFEGEASANARSQGGSLDLHKHTGLAALKKANLYDDFLKHARFDGESLRLTDANLRHYIDITGSDKVHEGGRPEIDRSHLRDILVNSLPDGMIRWNHRLRSVDDDLTLHFDHTTVSDHFDLLVGADGTWSKVRPLVTSVQPFYTGISGVRMGIRNASHAAPDISKLTKRGNVMAFSHNKSLNLQQLGDDSITINTWDRRPESWFQDLSFDPQHDPSSLKAQLKQDFEHYDPRFLRAIDAADEPPVLWKIYMLPVGHSWSHRPGVTLIGDCAIQMSPFAGEGVNLSMLTAMNLADAIVAAATTLASSPDVIDQAYKETILSKSIKAFEEDMFRYATVYQQVTYDAMRLMFFVPGAPDSVIEEYLHNVIKHDMPRVLAALSWPAICTYFWLWRRLGWGKMKD